MSFKALFKPVKATLSLTAVTAINTAMIGALLVSKSPVHGNPVSPQKAMKEAFDRVVNMTLAKVEGELTKSDAQELRDIADVYKQVLAALE